MREQVGNTLGNTPNDEGTPHYRGQVFPHHEEPGGEHFQGTPASDRGGPEGGPPPVCGLASRGPSTEHEARTREALTRWAETLREKPRVRRGR
jgi:hypothetical protein